MRRPNRAHIPNASAGTAALLRSSVQQDLAGSWRPYLPGACLLSKRIHPCLLGLVAQAQTSLIRNHWEKSKPESQGTLGPKQAYYYSEGTTKVVPWSRNQSLV